MMPEEAKISKKISRNLEIDAARLKLDASSHKSHKLFVSRLSITYPFGLISWKERMHSKTANFAGRTALAVGREREGDLLSRVCAVCRPKA